LFPNTIRIVDRLPPIRLVSLLFLLFAITGCNTKIEGCLELNASNFDFEAESPCDGCCTYPTANLSLTQKWNDGNYTNTDTLYDINHQPYIINDLKYFLSAWSWQDVDGMVYTVDSVSVPCNTEILTYTPDILTADTRKFAYPLGTIRLAPMTDSLFMTFGLVEDFSCLENNDETTPVNLNDQSPLWNSETASLETIRLILQRDLESVTFDTIFITTKLDFRLPYTLFFTKGMNESFNLTVDYAQWFQDADIGDLPSFEISILNHLQGSITPTN